MGVIGHYEYFKPLEYEYDEITILDCNDSFTHNLVGEFLSLGAPISVYNSHQANLDEVIDNIGKYLVLSPGPGRPKGPITGKSHKSALGRDPIAAKAISATFTTDQSPLQHTYRGGSPLSTESKEISSLINSMQSSKKSSKIIKQTMINEEKNHDEGTMLDESQLIED